MLRKFTGLLKRGSAVVVLASMAAFAGKASALAYVGEYDPLFTQNFAIGSSWSGNVTIDVPVECIPTTNMVTDVSKGACPGFKLLSATVFLSNPNGSLADTLGFPNTSTDPFNLILQFIFGDGSSLDDVRFLDKTPAAINGSFDAPVYTNAFNAPNSVTGTLFFLSFEQFTPVLSWGYIARFRTDGCFNILGCYIETGSSSTEAGNAGTAVWSNRTFQPVPEPGSLALLVLALGALGLVRVRKNGAPALG